MGEKGATHFFKFFDTQWQFPDPRQIGVPFSPIQPIIRLTTFPGFSFLHFNIKLNNLNNWIIVKFEIVVKFNLSDKYYCIHLVIVLDISRKEALNEIIREALKLIQANKSIEKTFS